MPPFPVRLTDRIAVAYAEGYSAHGNLQLSTVDYQERLIDVIEKYLGPTPSESRALQFIDQLHTSDLYLTTACAQMMGAAWERFYLQFGGYIERAVACAAPTSRMAKDLADNLAGHLCLLDSSGCRRIASYDGRSSLTTWLRAILQHQAVKEARREQRSADPLERLSDVADRDVIERLENEMRARRYAGPIGEALAQAGRCLSARERLVLRLRYEEGLDGAAIAHLLGVHPSTVTRTLQGSYERLRRETLAALATAQHLQPASVQECVADLLENPGHTLFPFILCPVG